MNKINRTHTVADQNVTEEERLPQGGCDNLLIGKMFAENGMKMKDFGPRGRP